MSPTEMMSDSAACDTATGAGFAFRLLCSNVLATGSGFFGISFGAVDDFVICP